MNPLIRRVLAAAALGLALATPAGAKAPNIVFILTDDLDAAAAAKMAQVKALITDQGTSFQRHFVNVSLCCPSRVSTLRGQFAHNSTIYGNNAPNGGFEGTYSKGLESSTIATWLQDAGYRTALFGKYLNGYPHTAPSTTYIPPGWTEWYSPNGGSPYSEFDYDLNENGTTVRYGSADSDYLTDVISDKAVDFIRRSVEQHAGQPFFAYVSTYAPHLPATPAPRHADMFPELQAPRTNSFNEADVSDKPTWVREAPLLSESEIATLDEQYRSRRLSLLAVDEMVKRIVDTLQALGQLDNTYVFFTSDNGFHQGEHRLASGKMTAFEEDLHIPLSVRGPGVPVGATVDALTANVDYASTFAELGGASTPGWVDGRSLVPLLQGQTPKPWRQALMLSHGEVGGEPRPSGMAGLLEPPDPFDTLAIDIPMYTGLRTADDYTYVAYLNGEFELYDNSKDLRQLRNRYGDASENQRARLAAWLAALDGASGEALRQAELRPPPACPLVSTRCQAQLPRRRTAAP
ncbi:sulfatase [Ideonella sp.]|uniref:sulfatase family protein n=1 Tax=Ideonella sp. TaxID=1929293 RepID=UPI0035B3BA1B